MKRTVIIAAAFTLLHCTIGAKAQEERGNRPTIGSLPATGQVDGYPYLIYQTSAPGSKKSGSFLGKIPRASLIATTSGDELFQHSLSLLKGGPSPVRLTARQIANAVANGQIPPETVYLLTLPVPLHLSVEEKKRVLEAFRQQSEWQIEDAGKPARPSLSQGDFDILDHQVMIAPARLVRLVVITPGFEHITFAPFKDPQLIENKPLEFQGIVSAAFLAQMTDAGGINMTVDFHCQVWRNNKTKIDAAKVAKDFVKILVNEHGKGKAQANGGESVEILSSSEGLQDHERQSNWQQSVHIIGSDPESINILLSLLRTGPDVFAASEQEIAEFIMRIGDEIKSKKDPSLLTALNKAVTNANEKQTESEEERLRRFISTWNEYSSNTSAGSFMGFSGGHSSAKGKGGSVGNMEQERKMKKELISSLHQYVTSTTGQLRLPPTLKLNLISTKRVERAITNNFTMELAGKITPEVFSSHFNTAAPPVMNETRDNPLDRPRLKALADRIEDQLNKKSK